MQIETQKDGDVVRVTLKGELKSESAEAVNEELHALVSVPDAKVAVDLSEVSLIDSSGLSALINVVTRGRLCTADVVFANPTPFVRSVFEVARLDTFFEIHPNMAAATDRLTS